MKKTKTIIITLGILIVLISFANAQTIPCDFESFYEYDGYSPPNFTLYENDKIFCKDATLKLRGLGSNWTTNFKIEGNFTLLNSTLETAYGLVTNFTVLDEGIFNLNKTSVISMENKGEGFRRDGTYNISTEQGSKIKIINTIFNNLTNLKSETDGLYLENVLLNNAPLYLYNIFFAQIKNVSSNNELFINDTTFIEIINSKFKLSNLSYIIESNNLKIINTTFNRINESNLKIEDSNILMENITFIDEPEPFYTNITLDDKTYIKFIDTNSNNTSIIDDKSYFDQYFTIYYNITKKINKEPISKYMAESFNRTNQSFIIKQANAKGLIALPLISFTRNLTNTHYYSNYTTFFTKENYETENNTINVTESKYINLTMKTLKGIIRVEPHCTSEYIFCAEKNPIFIKGMTANQRETVTFVVNATGNSNSIKGITYPFFVIVTSDLEEVETKESSAINITIV